MRAGWLGIVLAAAMAFGCSQGTDEDNGATHDQDGGSGSGGTGGGGGNAGSTGGTGGGSGEQGGGGGTAGAAGGGGSAGSIGGNGGSGDQSGGSGGTGVAGEGGTAGGGSGGRNDTGGTGGGDTVIDAGVDQVVLDAIESHGLIIVGRPSTVEVTLPAELNDPNWGLKQMICEDAGYSLAPYAGQNVLLTAYDIDMTCQGALLRVWVVTQGNDVACVYLSVREGVDLVPGVFPVNVQC